MKTTYLLSLSIQKHCNATNQNLPIVISSNQNNLTDIMNDLSKNAKNFSDEKDKALSHLQSRYIKRLGISFSELLDDEENYKFYREDVHTTIDNLKRNTFGVYADKIGDSLLNGEAYYAEFLISEVLELD